MSGVYLDISVCLYSLSVCFFCPLFFLAAQNSMRLTKTLPVKQCMWLHAFPEVTLIGEFVFSTEAKECLPLVSLKRNTTEK